MCSTKTKPQAANVSHFIGHRSRVSLLDRRSSLKIPSSAGALAPLTPQSASPPPPPLSPKIKSPRRLAVKRSGNDSLGLSSSDEKVSTPRGSSKAQASVLAKKSRSAGGGGGGRGKSAAAALVGEEPGSVAAAMREEAAIMQVLRKMRIAHYGRSMSGKVSSHGGEASAVTAGREEKRLFELLVLTGAQVGSDWAFVLKKRQDFREAFCGFSAELVSKYTEKKMISISVDYGIQLNLVRAAVDNSIKILEIKREMGSFDEYVWAFVNHKQVATHYKWSNKIPAKTSKSEAISKDLVRRGFRYVGPTTIFSFMQAAGLTNDHLTTCPRHLPCAKFSASPPPRNPPAAPTL